MNFVTDGSATTDKKISLKTEICIIGSGAGGAVAGFFLAQAGYEVTILEAGHFHPPGSQEGKSETHIMATLYEKSAMQMNASQDVMILQGRAIGGSTLVNQAVCYRLPEQIADKWTMDHQVEGKTLADLSQYYEKVEKVITPKITPEQFLNENNKIAMRGFKENKWNNGYMKRNTSHCVGCGSCPMSCSIGAKNSMDRTFLPMAHQAGAKIISGFQATEIRLKKNSIEKIVGKVSNKDKSSFEIFADTFILAGGAIQTPVLLQRSKYKDKSGQIGKNLIIHPFIFPQALFDRKLDSFKGVPQAVYSFEFAHFGHKELGSILLYGDFEGFVGSAFQMSGVGDNFGENLANFRHLAQSLVIINETARGVITASASDYKIEYELTDRDRETLAAAARHMGNVFFSQGARKYFVGNKEYKNPQDLQKISAADMEPYKINIIGAHPMGTCRMGKPENSVVDSYGKIHDLENGYICDASILPDSTGVNPQLTIMAIAAQIAERIDLKLKSRGERKK